MTPDQAGERTATGSSLLAVLRRWIALPLWFVAAAHGAEFFVAPDASGDGDGSAAKPWSLAVALGHPAALRPGDTIWVRDGLYSGGFTSTLQGAANAPITVRAAGKRATIDCKPRDADDTGSFTVRGEWTTFRGLEFTCTGLQRVTATKGSWPADIRRGGITSHGSQIRFINLIVHDTAGGFGFWGNEQSGEGGEIYGCIIYHNGWKGPDRGHGHGVYAQNARGTKRIVDNVIFNQFGYGLHVYGSSKAFLRGFHVEGNVAFQNGCLAGPSERTHDLFIGGGAPIENLTLLENFAYGAGLRLGYSAEVRNRGVVARNNYLAGSARITALEEIEFTGNTLLADGTLLSFDQGSNEGGGKIIWDANVYLRTKVEWAPFNFSERGQTAGLTYREWQNRTGFDAKSSYIERRPHGTKVIVRANQFEKGRAHIIIYNWEKYPAVEINLKTVLEPGDEYRIVSAQDFFGEPVLTGRYTGDPVRLPMSGRKPVQPVGMPDYPLPVTEPEFGVFVVLPAKGGS